ncbi:MAG: UDP-N-acetylmuramoyl-tripeptide--D-alanyl-D-alanine ligase [Chlorobium sp.]
MKGVLSINDFWDAGEVVVSGPDSPPLEIVEPKVVIDSREITEGSIFVALKGERTDGHSYIQTVFDGGASWAMVSGEWYEAAGSPMPPSGKGFLVSSDPVAGLQHLSTMYRSTFSFPVVAIGGSNGKTTTKEMVASVLGTGFKVTVSQGNRNNHLGVPLTLLQLRRDTGIAVVEVGINHPGEMALLADIARPTHALLTNIGHEHLEFLLDLDGVAAAETQLYDYLRRSGGMAFINTDDQRLRYAGEGLAGSLCYGTSESPANTFWAREIAVEQDGRLSFLLCSVAGSEKVILNFTGKHNVINAVAAAAVGSHFGLSLRQIREGLESLAPAPGWKRLEVVDLFGLRILNDTYNANSDSMQQAIEALCDMPCGGKRVAVLGDMLELGAAGDVEHETIGRYIQQRPVDILLTFGDKAQLIGREAPGACRGHFESREQLLERLLALLHEDDVVLFKGSRGMKLELVVESLITAKTIIR